METTDKLIIGGLTLVGLGTIMALNKLYNPSSVSTAYLGWEVWNLSMSGVDAYAEILQDMYISKMLVSFSLSILSVPTRPDVAMVLTTMHIVDTPQIEAGTQGYPLLPPDSRFSPVTYYNPYTLPMNTPPFLGSTIYSDISKIFVTSNGDGGTLNKLTEVTVNRKVSSGQYILFHIDSYNPTIPLDTELQITFLIQ